ncbi:Uncharacterised protein [Chryseobacterium gleum]|uniref:DUF6759 domain-containing protein n=2 Tax=Chryseobacterium gleum TaxID=250 RepID=A0A3S4M7C5_CHRGE|nr:DUF6759 domain-containing protein [Chryseobacterium gleum]EFK36560.1 hypothetical protein HMPREF0204_11592 [Chryseobacterium gleum ATCC 35910]QQY33400.1 hypothetical protein I6I60_06405 [Chryseobacterium gleum]VEE08820.1 Uncharacterised protein [Chryseobacterium gleum]
MKKVLLLLSCMFLFTVSAQKKGKDYSDILKSKNIYEINAFLRDAHPDDPRRSVLKPRVMEMMREYIKNAHPADQKVKDMQEMLAMLKRRPSTKITFDEMNAIIKQKQIAKYKAELAAKQPTTVYTPSNAQNTFVVNATANTAIPNAEAEEFNMLMAVSPVEHKNRTVKILNSLFNNDPNAKECIVMIQNKSDCNIIVRIEGVGTTKYRLAVPAQGEGSIVIEKGQYLFSSLVCGAQYASQKTIERPIMVALGSH